MEGLLFGTSSLNLVTNVQRKQPYCSDPSYILVTAPIPNPFSPILLSQYLCLGQDQFNEVRMAMIL
jgi:hypothetical protein